MLHWLKDQYLSARYRLALFRLRWAKKYLSWKLRRLYLPPTLKEVPTTLPGPLGTPRVAVLGEFSAGKSSLINALLRETSLPTGIVETTAVATVIRHGSEIRCAVETERGETKRVEADQVVRMTHGSSALSGDVVRIHFSAPDPLLCGMEFVDTPGINTVHGQHVSAANHIADDSPFWVFVTRSEQAMKLSEVQWLRENHVGDHYVFFVVNQADRLPAKQLRKVLTVTRQTIREHLNISPAAVLPMCSRGAGSELDAHAAKMKRKTVARLLRSLRCNLRCYRSLLYYRQLVDAQRAFREEKEFAQRRFLERSEFEIKRLESEVTLWERAARIPYATRLRQLMNALARDYREMVLGVYSGEFDRMFNKASCNTAVWKWSWKPPALTRSGRPLETVLTQELQAFFANPSIITAGDPLSLPPLRPIGFTMRPDPGIGLLPSIFYSLFNDTSGEKQARKNVEKQHLLSEKARLLDYLNKIDIPRVERRLSQVGDAFIEVERKLCMRYAREAARRLGFEQRLLARFRRTFQTGEE